MRQHLLPGLLLLLVSLAAARAFAVVPASGRFSLSVDGETVELPYLSNRPIDAADGYTTRILVSIHSSSYSAADYLDNGVDAAASAGEEAQTLVIAPHFLEADAISGAIDADLLYWNVSPFWGSVQGRRGPEASAVSVSAYEVLDRLLQQVVDSGRFPNLASVVIAGHSAGGQMVQRYAATNRFDHDAELPGGVELRYVAMAPSSYVYLDGARPVSGSAYAFATPSAAELADCPDYNEYGYGLEDLYSYPAATGVAAIREQYSGRRVYYLVGDADNDPYDDSLSVTCAALLQGEQRQQRMEAFHAYLKQYYGASVLERHVLSVVPGIGHSGRQLMLSSAGLTALFTPQAPSCDLSDDGLLGLADLVLFHRQCSRGSAVWNCDLDGAYGFSKGDTVTFYRGCR